MTTRVLTTHSSASVGARRWEDQVQQTADMLALIPIVNVPASIVSGLISLRKRDYTGVALSMLGLIPLEGEGATLLKLARDVDHVHNLVKTGTCVVRAIHKIAVPSSPRPVIPPDVAATLPRQRKLAA